MSRYPTWLPTQDSLDKLGEQYEYRYLTEWQLDALAGAMAVVKEIHIHSCPCCDSTGTDYAIVISLKDWQQIKAELGMEDKDE
jgi:hypothetical protein